MDTILQEYSGVINATSIARGILATSEHFSFLFGLVVSEKLFTITDTLSKAVQQKTICAVDAKRYASLTISRLKEEREDEKFESLWKNLLLKRIELEMAEPTLPHKQRAPFTFMKCELHCFSPLCTTLSSDGRLYLSHLKWSGGGLQAIHPLYMKKERVNNLMMLYIHKDRKIDIAEAMREFISRNSEGVVFFGKLYNNFIDIVA